MKTKALISFAVIRFAVTAKLICAFVFACADCWFSHGAAQILEITFQAQHRACTIDKFRVVMVQVQESSVIIYYEPPREKTGIRKADQPLCFCYTDSTILFLV